MNRDQFPFTDFLEVISSTPPPIVVGGQAVNLWAEYFLGRSQALKAFGPFLSKDCDLYGSMELLHELAQRTKWEMKIAPPDQASPVVGYLAKKNSQGKDLLVEVLFTVKGLTPEDFKKCDSLELKDKSVVAVLSPVTLLKAKIANALELPQRNALGDESRDDIRHVKILVECVNLHVSDALQTLKAQKTTDRAVVNLLEKTFKVVSTLQAAGLARRENIDFKNCFPSELLTEPSEKLQNFCKFRLAPWAP